jgi:hypothetical protein
VATITTLTVYDEKERCSYCQKLHVVDRGGPAAAVAKAIRYLDSYHEGDRMMRVQSDFRGLGGEPPARTASAAETFAAPAPDGTSEGIAVAPAALPW